MAQVTVTCDCPDQPPQAGMQAFNWQDALQRIMPFVVQIILALAGGNPPVGGQGQQQGGAPQSRR